MVFLFGDTEAPIPPPKDAPNAAVRPGTAGTLLVLRNERERTSDAFEAAAKAERLYVQQRHAQKANVDAKEARAHFKEAHAHFKAGCVHSLGFIKYIPDSLRQKNDERKVAANARKKEKEAWRARKTEAEKVSKDGEVEEGTDAIVEE